MVPFSYYFFLEVRVFSLLISALSKHGSDTINLLVELFENEWSVNSREAGAWPDNLIRSIILDLVQITNKKEWAITWFKKLEPPVLENDPYSIVDSYLERAKTWAELGEKDLTKENITDAIAASFGVGFRKDYQLDYWIEWLGRINVVEPQKAQQRIQWIANAIKRIDNYSENKVTGYAFNVLLKITFKWSPRSAIRLYIWGVENTVAWSHEALNIILLESLKASDSSLDFLLDIIQELVLKISVAGNEYLLDLLLEHVEKTKGKDATIGTATHLLSIITIHAYPSEREKWAEGIRKRLTKIGVSPGEFGLSVTREENSSWKDNNLLLDNPEEELTREQVLKNVSSIKELIALKKREQNESHFWWHDIFDELYDTISLNDIDELLSLFQKDGSLRSRISNKLSDLGEKERAWDIALRALETSNPLGWGKEYDGGTRINAFKALAKINPSAARDLAYNYFNNDFKNNPLYSFSIIANLEPVISFFSNGDIPITEIWPEIENYLNVLFNNLNLNEPDQISLSSELENDTAEHALIDLLLYFLGSSEDRESSAALRTLSILLLKDNTFIKETLNHFAEMDSLIQRPILVALIAVLNDKSQIIEQLKPQIISLQSNDDYFISAFARYISEQNRFPCPIYLKKEQDDQEKILELADPELLLVEPCKRPTYIAPLKGDDGFAIKEDWAQKAQESLSLIDDKTPDGYEIIAQFSILDYSFHYYPRETRTICLHRELHSTSIEEAHKKGYYPSVKAYLNVRNVPIRNYLNLQEDNNNDFIIVKNFCEFEDYGGKNWMAIHPLVALKMGWDYSTEGLFRWIDDTNTVMVESIWWKDGFIERNAFLGGFDCGEGWVVIASKIALERMEQELGTIKKHIYITRSYMNNSSIAQEIR